MPLRRIKNEANEIEEEIKKKRTKFDSSFDANEGNFKDGVLSTGSTLLNLSISGGRIEGGGIPGGVLVEVFGPSQVGKTAILAEVAASAQSKGGEAKFADPEARLDKEYSKIYGFKINEENYSRPNTVKEVFKPLRVWSPIENKINVYAADSLAALSTEMEMEEEEGDKRGQKRAKDFSEQLRKHCRILANNNWVMICSNQIRQGDRGYVTPGGEAIKFYSSIRIKMSPAFPGSKIIKKIKNSAGVEIEKAIGIKSNCEVIKSVDDPYRECSISIIFGYGIDDIRDQLEYYKAMTKENTFNSIEKSFRSLDQAVEYIEQNKLVKKLKERTIGIWQEMEELFSFNRKRIKKER
jgi:RecA/RadA recombinase